MNDATQTPASGQVVAIHVAETRGAPMRALERVRAIKGSGLEGDRYAVGDGRWSVTPAPDRQVTLVEEEEIVRLGADAGIALEPGELRRNLTTRGVRLSDLVGRTFRVGGVTLEGVRLCEPCSYLQGLIGKPILEPLVHRAGLRAVIVEGGEIGVGDSIIIA